MIPVKYCIKYEALKTMKECEVVLNKYPDFDCDEMHSHAFIEVAYVSKGNGWHVMGNQIFRCGAGDIYIINVGDTHFWMSEYDAPLTIHNLIFRPGFFDITLLGRSDFADVMGSFLLESFNEEAYFDSTYVHFSEEEQPEICRLFDNMLKEYETHEQGFQELIRSWTIDLLVRIFRKQKKDENHRRIIRDSNAAALAPVIGYIDAHYTENIPLNKLASLAYLSPAYFSRTFKELTGSTVTDYIQNKRILLAKELLRTTRYPVSHIAEACGYSDAKHFTKLFKRITGDTPVSYRKEQTVSQEN